MGGAEGMHDLGAASCARGPVRVQSLTKEALALHLEAPPLRRHARWLLGGLLLRSLSLNLGRGRAPAAHDRGTERSLRHPRGAKARAEHQKQEGAAHAPPRPSNERALRSPYDELTKHSLMNVVG